MKKEISNKFTIFNFIFTLVICNYHHSMLDGRLAFFAMATFFMVSGYLLYANLNTMEDAKRKILKRVYSLLVPLLIWNTFCIFLNAIRGGELEFSLNFILQNYFFGPSDGPIWYMIAIFILALFTPIFCALKKYKKLNTAIFILILSSLFVSKYFTIHTVEQWWWLPNLVDYLPYYVIGSFIGMYFDKFISQDGTNYTLNIISLVICALLCVITRCTVWLNEIGFLANATLMILFWLAVPERIFKGKFKGGGVL